MEARNPMHVLMPVNSSEGAQRLDQPVHDVQQ